MCKFSFLKALPEAIENKILNYKQQLNMKDVLNELLKNKYICASCYDLKFENVTMKLKKCKKCEEPICYECQDNFLDEKGEYCNDCHFHEEIIMLCCCVIKRDYSNEEITILDNIILELNMIEKEELFDFLLFMFGNYLEHDFMSLPIETIFTEINSFLSGEYNAFFIDDEEEGELTEEDADIIDQLLNDEDFTENESTIILENSEEELFNEEGVFETD